MTPDEDKSVSAAARIRLATALRVAGASPAMIDRARDGYYGDFTSPLDRPITQLIIDAEKEGLRDIARRAKDGEFDG